MAFAQQGHLGDCPHSPRGPRPKHIRRSALPAQIRWRAGSLVQCPGRSDHNQLLQPSGHPTVAKAKPDACVFNLCDRRHRLGNGGHNARIAPAATLTQRLRSLSRRCKRRCIQQAAAAAAARLRMPEVEVRVAAVAVVVGAEVERARAA
eukprot:6150662-Prymnesium_polylepis.2